MEDALRATSSPRSKLDFYQNHLYLQILVQHTHPSDEALLTSVADETSESGRIAAMADGDENVHSGVVGEGVGVGTRYGRGGRWGGRGAGGLGRSGGLGGRRQSVVDGMERAVMGKKMMRLPEGVEGVFEPTVTPSRLQSDKVVSITCDINPS